MATIVNKKPQYAIFFTHDIIEETWLYSPKLDMWFPNEYGPNAPWINNIEEKLKEEKYTNFVDMALSIIEKFPNCSYFPQPILNGINKEYPKNIILHQIYGPIKYYKNVLMAKKASRK